MNVEWCPSNGIWYIRITSPVKQEVDKAHRDVGVVEHMTAFDGRVGQTPRVQESTNHSDILRIDKNVFEFTCVKWLHTYKVPKCACTHI